MHQPHHRVNRVDLEPAAAKIGTVGVLVMIILEQFAQHQEVERSGVFGLVLIIKVGITVLMATPVYNSAVDRAHHKMDGQQQEQPPVRSKKDIKTGIGRAKQYS